MFVIIIRSTILEWFPIIDWLTIAEWLTIIDGLIIVDGLIAIVRKLNEERCLEQQALSTRD